jgi:hypothetical protein
VWPDNWHTLQLFLQCQSTWESAPLIAVGPTVRGGGLLRMNYPAVWCVLNARCSKRKRNREFIRLQAMEFAVLESNGE